ncbi:MAG: SRPBCC family protein [Candidatus Zhuqueibacterota bacterium]
MRIVKLFILALLILIAVILISGLILPRDYLMEKTIVISAPKELVFEHVRYWRNWDAWSPWIEMDSLMVSKIEGTDGEVGSAYSWVGDPKVTGKGEMKTTAIKDNEEMAYHTHFYHPWERESDGYLRLVDEAGAVKVVWAFYGTTPFPWNVGMLFVNLDDVVGKDFERGLVRLKQLCETEATEISKYQISEIEFSGRNYAAIRSTVAFSDIQNFMTASFGEIQQTMKQKGMRMVGAPVGLYFFWDMPNNSTEMAAGIPITGSIDAGNVQTITVEAGRALTVDYYGPYDKSQFAHMAMDFYMKRNALTQKAIVLEEYITDPMTESDSSKWLTKIIYFVQ